VAFEQVDRRRGVTRAELGLEPGAGRAAEALRPRFGRMMLKHQRNGARVARGAALPQAIHDAGNFAGPLVLAELGLAGDVLDTDA
jgi:hypothetical protein